MRGAHPEDLEGHRMRPMARTLTHPGDIESVAEYVSKMSLVRPAHSMIDGDPAAGGAKYNSVCVACHGADGRGMEALKSPWLSGQSDWYLYAQLLKFRSGMRGAHSQDLMGSQMRAMAMTLENDAAVKNVVAYIRTLQK
jgi:cytochrome c oxidase subunit 2